jgi:cobalt-precorrin-5B (C1)-methyltransferase
MGDYLRFAMRATVNLGFTHVTVGAFFGKAVKIAQGFGHTHASRGLANFRELARLINEVTGDPALAQAVARANTAREVLENLPAASSQAILAEVGRRMLTALRNHAGPAPELAAVIMNFDGAPLFWGGEVEGAR